MRTLLSTSSSHAARARVITGAMLTSILIFGASNCGTTEHANDIETRAALSSTEAKASIAAWKTIYAVLESPRCSNCHPADGIPKQGDDAHIHAQNVQRGTDGQGRFAMRCETCHQTSNVAGAHMPPGAPNWHLPKPEMPLVFVGRTSAELCRQLKDPQQNGDRTLKQLYEHMAHDPLVLWGWSPGEGRTPVPTSHDEFVRAVRTWIDGGCGCPE